MISTIQHKVLVEPELHVTKDHNSSNHTDFMQPNGIASLDIGGKVPLSQLPLTILDGLQYKGTWDCSSGAYPVLTSTGDYYICNVAGSISGVDYFVGDWLAYNGTTWNRVEGSSNFRSLLRTSTSYVITDTDGYGIIEVDPKGITVPIYLPTALDNRERLLTIKNVDTGTVTITGEGAETIDGYATYSLRVSGDSWIGYSNGVEWKTVGGSSSASGTSFVVTQTTHSLSVLNAVYLNAGTWTKARANSSATLATHVVTQVLDADNFMAAQSGRFLITSHGLTPYSYYYLSSSSAGELTTSEPTTFSNLLVFVESADYVHILPYRPLDTTLIALRDLNTSTGLIVETSTDVFTKRTIYGTTNKITVTNGNGISGHPTLNIGSDVVTLTDSQILSNKTFSDQIISTQTTGTPPFVVTSSTGITNLNADLWDGYQFSDYLDQSVKQSSSPTFIKGTFTQTTGTPPFTITSSTGIVNLNADLLDGNHSSAFAVLAHNHALATLSDVTLTSLANNHILIYSSTRSKWVNTSTGQFAMLAGSGGVVAFTAPITITNTTKTAGGFYSGTTDPTTSTGRINFDGKFYATKVYNAVWNDYADHWPKKDESLYYAPGLSYADYGEGLECPKRRADSAIIGIYSDTFGMAVGKEDKSIPISVTGFVLAYVDKEYKSGTLLTNLSGGILTKANFVDTLLRRTFAKYIKKENNTLYNGLIVNDRHWVKVL